ncbi:MAG: hypothetical protein JWR63_511 [Conexibacter sp.]|nr:hypothetical protein [Conexibacter sp.]
MGVIVAVLGLLAGVAAAALAMSIAGVQSLHVERDVLQQRRHDERRAIDDELRRLQYEDDPDRLRRRRAKDDGLRYQSRLSSLHHRRDELVWEIGVPARRMKALSLVVAAATAAFLVIFAAAMLIASGPAASHDRERLQAIARVDLTDSDLSKADLRGEVLVGKRFVDADLSDANLRAAVLRGVRFDGARLRGANLSFAIADRASFQRAHLHGASLRRASLRGADFSAADLEDADLRGALYDGATRWPHGFDPRTAGAVRVRG